MHCARHFAPRCRVGVLAVPKWHPPTAGGFAESFRVTVQGCPGLTPPLYPFGPVPRGREALFPTRPMLFASSQTCCRISLAVREAAFLNQCPRGSLLCCLQEVPSSLGFCVSWFAVLEFAGGLSWGFTLESWSSLNWLVTKFFPLERKEGLGANP